MSKDLEELINRTDHNQEELATIIKMMREQMARNDSGLKPLKMVVPKAKEMPQSVMANLLGKPTEPTQKMRRR